MGFLHKVYLSSIFLSLFACGTDYHIRGITIYPLNDKPTKQCMIEIFDWVENDNLCDLIVNFQGIKSIIWTDHYLFPCKNPKGCSGIYRYNGQILVKYKKPIERSSIIHEFNHHFLTLLTGNGNGEHTDESWPCVKKLKQKKLFDKCD